MRPSTGESTKVVSDLLWQVPGLVVMDFDLPGISGLETTR